MATPTPPVRQGDLLRAPIPAEVAACNFTRYRNFLPESLGIGRSFSNYQAVWKWSVDEPDEFARSLIDFFGVDLRPEGGSEFFRGKLNYAAHLLRSLAQQERAATPAIIFQGEDRDRRGEISRRDLVKQVTALAESLKKLGVQRGDRVVGYLPNLPETVVAFIAAASLGAVWSNCPAELSSRGVIERFGQIEPIVLFAVSSYRYGGKVHDRQEALREIAAGLPTLRHIVEIAGPGEGLRTDDWPSHVSYTAWADLLARADASAPLVCEIVPFDHPLWILYSSGTTGIPKAIVHGHGGILLEHLKTHALQLDTRAGDRFFWYTSAGWMMWNLLVSGLLLPGTTILLYDGSPKFPDFHALWDLVERECVTYFGTSAPFLTACMKEGVVPRARGSFPALRTIGSTGAPLPAEAFGWIHALVKTDVLVGSMSGGTDVCTAFVLSCPVLPEFAGELQCLALGASIEAWNEDGQPIYGQVGELVVTKPYLSMPICFWNDPDGSRFRASYYEKFPGVWSHGDWIEIAAPGLRCVIHGRSDSTLNRGGVRMGTAEFYSVVEEIPGVADALVIDTGALGREGALLLFVVPQAGTSLDDKLRNEINARLRANVSPRHLPDAIYAVPELPRTLNGKKLEVPVKRILSGMPLEKAVSRAAVANPESLRYFVDLFNNL